MPFQFSSQSVLGLFFKLYSRLPTCHHSGVDLKPGGNRARTFPNQWNGSVPDVTTIVGNVDWSHSKMNSAVGHLLLFLVQLKPEIKCVCLAEILLVSRAKTYRKCTFNSLLLHASGLELPMHPANSVTRLDTRVKTINAWEKHNPVPKLTYLFFGPTRKCSHVHSTEHQFASGELVEHCSGSTGREYRSKKEHIATDQRTFGHSWIQKCLSNSCCLRWPGLPCNVKAQILSSVRVTTLWYYISTEVWTQFEYLWACKHW